MSRYIDADAFLKEYCAPYPHVFMAMSKAMAEAPSIDIVRCKECKWCDGNGANRALICTNEYIDIDCHPDFYCGYGEREGE